MGVINSRQFSHKIVVFLKKKFSNNIYINLVNHKIPLCNDKELTYIKDILIPINKNIAIDIKRFIKPKLFHHIRYTSGLTLSLIEEIAKKRPPIHQIKTLNKPPHGNNLVYSDQGVSPSLTTMQGGNRMPFVFEEKNLINFNPMDYPIRKLCPIECERLMGWPDNWTKYGKSNDQIYEVPKIPRYKAIGNGIVASISKEILEKALDNNINYKIFSTFSGVDGSTLSLNENFIKVGFAEYDPKAKIQHNSHILAYHYPHIKNHGDITKIKEEDVPDHDIIFISAPCQSFSTAGIRAGLDDARGTLFYETARIMSIKKPKYFIFENVKGLLSHNNGKTFEHMCEIYSSLGYELDFELLNAKNFGVAQNRERVFMIGKLKHNIS